MTSRSTDKRVRYRLSKSEILRGYRAFGQVFARGAYVQNRSIRLYYDIRREIPPYQCTVGFAVRKARNAVQRNRFRRLMRESFRQRKHALMDYCFEQRLQMNCVMLIDSQRIAEPVTYKIVDTAVESLLDAVLKRMRQA